MRLFFIFFVTFPTMFSYSIVYYIKYPHAKDAGSVIIMAPVFFVLTLVTQYLGYKMIMKIRDERLKKNLKIARLAGLIGGLAFLLMFFFII